MSDLSDFGGGIETSESSEETDAGDSRYKYSAGRCEALSKTNGRRCRQSASEGDLCYNHDLDDHCVTIDDDPVTLIEWTSGKLFENLDELDVDEDLIRGAVHNLVGLEDERLPVYEDGFWLPERYTRASWLIVRTPAKTARSHRSGTEPRRRISPLATAGDWDPDYLEGEGRTAEIRNEECLPGDDGVPKIGLKIAGEEQRWIPVEIKDGDRDV